MQIAFVLYDRFTALDIIGPFNVLAYVPGVEARFVAETLEPVTADVGRPVIVPDLTFAECDRPDIVVVPGGPGSTRIAELTALTDWLRRVHPTTPNTTTVCTGAHSPAPACWTDCGPRPTGAHSTGCPHTAPSRLPSEWSTRVGSSLERASRPGSTWH